MTDELTGRAYSDIWHDPIQGAALSDHLTYLYQEGYSFGVIGARLGISRNMAAGKLSRLGVSRDYAPATMVRPPYKPREHLRLDRPLTGFNRRTVRAANKVRLPPTPPKLTRRKADKSSRVAISQLENNHCRWPLWRIDAPLKEKFYCGAAADLRNARPYCAVHEAIAFNR